MNNDFFGDRIKGLEFAETAHQFIPLLPIIIRLDGRSFHSYTNGLERPFDIRMVKSMVATTKALVEETNAVIGYTQSDEITLVLYSDNYDSQLWFDGKKFKILSCAASFCSVEFYKNICKEIPEKVGTCLTFDCRAFNVPNEVEAANTVLWREIDSSRNSISSAARSYYGHSELDGKSSSEKQEMLFAKGINWNDYPSFFKRGTFIQRRKTSRKFTSEELFRLPPKHNARINPDLVIERTDVVELDMPPFTKVLNRVDVVFRGADPIVATE